MRARYFVLAVLLGTAMVVLTHSLSDAGDWPAWRGPARNGVSEETGLLQKWPEDGPKLLWKTKGLGSGYSTPSVAGGKIYVMGTKSDVGGKGKGGGKGGFGGFGGGPSVPEYLFCLDAEKEGKVLWSTEIGKTAGGFPGPRCTPTVADGRVFVLSSNGLLACLSADKGSVLWKKDLADAFGGKKGMFGYCESPLVDGDVVVVTPGGSKATLVALKVKDGAEVWKSSITGLKMKEGKGKGGFGGGKGGFGPKAEYNTAAYSSVIKAEVKGSKQYVQFLSGGVVGVSAKDGKLLWHYDEPSCGMANCSTPIVEGNAVFAASGYGNGGGKALLNEKNGAFEAKQSFFVNRFQNQHGNMVLVKGHVYGTDESALLCMSFEDGEVLWNHARGGGKGSVTYADGHIYHRGEKGTVVLVEANPKKYVEKGRFRQPDRSDQNAWASPVVAGGKLYLRDWNTLLCYDVKDKGKEK